MSDISFEYDFDPYGENTNNFISKEAHTITAANGTDFNFIVPRYAPFFRRSFVCRNLTTALTLRPSVDYFFGFRFDQVIVSGSSLPVYGAIVFNDPSLSANVEIDYQTLGGEFVQSAADILTLMANTVNDPRTLQWSAVVDLPTEFPPIAHRHDVNDVTTFSDVISAIYDLSDAQAAGFNKAMQALMEHINDHNNPHHITLADLGIDELGNLVPATLADAQQGTDNVRYMTALRVNQEMTSLFLPILQQHEDDTSNPHGVTAAQVGLGLVSNYRIANALEAAAGVANNLYLTPAGGTLLAQNIVPTIMLPHTSNLNNPHQVTAAQVGLGLVPNFAVATDEVAIAGVSTTTLVTPRAVSLMLQNGSQQTIAAHINDHTNPHEVTAAQVGLGLVQNYTMADDTAASSATRSDLYLSPNNLGHWWTTIGKVYTDNAISLATNLNAEDVGLGDVVNAGFATSDQINAGTATQVYVDPAAVTTSLSNNVINRNFSCDNAFVAKLIAGYPAGQLVASSVGQSTGKNNHWTYSLRNVISPVDSVSRVAALIATAPATYTQAAYVDVSVTDNIPGFLFGSYTDTGGLNHYAAILLGSTGCYLGVYNGTTWSYGTATPMSGLTGTSTLVSMTQSGTDMTVTVGSTSVTIDISSVTFVDGGFVSSAGFVSVGVGGLVFTPTSTPALTASLINVTTSQQYLYSAGAWSEDTTTALPTTLATDLRPGRIVLNNSTGEGFIVLDIGNYFLLTQQALIVRNSAL